MSFIRKKRPIAQDNDFETWRAFGNRYWPAKYLVDQNGIVRYTHFGEGGHELKLSSNSDGFALFAFTFGSYAEGP